MGLLSLNQLKPDMVLANDVKGISGRLLLAKGTRLTVSHLSVFKMWGVVEADVGGESSKDTEEDALARLDPRALRDAEEIIRRRFIHCELDQPAPRKLLQLCTLRKAEELSKAGPGEMRGRRSEDKRLSPDNASETNYNINPVIFIQKEVSLPALPVIIFHINATINKPDSSPREITNVISKDVSLSARLLKLVNSAFYGFPSKIDTLSRAVLVIGTRQLSTLATAIELLTLFKQIPSDLVNMKSFMEHSIACGILARILATYKNIQNTERLFVGGLLHDIGRLILYSHMPLGAKEAILKARHDDELLCRTEREIFGCDHAKIGGLILKKWKFPASLETIVAHHHAPAEYKDPLESSLVHIADAVINAIEKGSSGEIFVPALNRAAWECVGLSPNILPPALKELELQYESVQPYLV